MRDPDFEKNLFITYLDEVTAYDLGAYSYTAIASISMKKDYYINNIEARWKELRKKYCIPEGTCLHFTDIKALLNKKYFNRPEKERNFNIEKAFCNGKVVDKDKLYNFYIDIIKIINECEFDVLITGARYDKSSNLKKHKTKMQNNWYTLFKGHLDNLAEYMVFKSENNKKRKLYSTKLRYDGDEYLESKPHILHAYADTICNGTSRFNTDHCRKCFNSLKFIGKEEVGSVKEISHAGMELLDFIALYAVKYDIKDIMIEDYIKFKNVSYEEAEKYVNKQIKIYIGEKDIYPHKSIENKIYKNK